MYNIVNNKKDKNTWNDLLVFTHFLFNNAPKMSAIVAATNNYHNGIPVLSLNAEAII